MVYVGVADVVVRLNLELGLHSSELVFQHHEVDADVVLFPELSLVTYRAIRTAPDEVSQGFHETHHVHGDDTGGITRFQRPINVKANELRQACTSCTCNDGDNESCRLSVWIMPSGALSF